MLLKIVKAYITSKLFNSLQMARLIKSLMVVPNAALDIAVDTSFEVLPEFVERLPHIGYQLLAHALNLTHQAVLLQQYSTLPFYPLYSK